MAQVFKPYANTIARASLAGLAATPFILGLSIAAVSRSPLNTKVDVAVNQPVPFSHEHHAWELGIDCRYCHTSVEESTFAGIPGSETCMSCHSQIWTNSPMLEPVRESYITGTPIQWTRVNKAPEFVYFRHDIHIARGINCNICHGAVQEMQITWKGNSFQMAWCLECHRAPEQFVYKDEENPHLSPRQQVFNLYWKLQEKGAQGLTHRERQILGAEDYSPSKEEVEKGRQLVEENHIQVQELADCSICHN